MFPAEFEPANRASERPQTHALDGAGTEICTPLDALGIKRIPYAYGDLTWVSLSNIPYIRHYTSWATSALSLTSRLSTCTVQLP